MAITERDLAERQRVIDEARAASFLDAVFLIYFYNHDTLRWGPPPKPPRIEPEDVFETYARDELQACLAQAHKMRSAAIRVAEAGFGYESAVRSAEDALKIFYEANPGFSARCYAKALSAGLIDAR